jgi:hypothetical protein
MYSIRDWRREAMISQLRSDRRRLDTFRRQRHDDWLIFLLMSAVLVGLFVLAIIK